ncbi:16S rRNA (guanine(527)-N(7))-methyltransferase RsmG [Geomesophilobacter sediminis]|uniref:Ribosomal RNA small subunit methyltransferase G n=1 Tax=Geomesophilobacter sediminis TaxID=2798584 RepID=A0A8J7J8X1_9BACT|nr:16S rRNA (guanine(527)-N(7))-methyltransferase RsmG [Geomesophilobacter sediminis]MBJ6726176.1 16S rRNA (guanine(527)-N(7))-methyltransferase RsmG [Geomesophilobacter sediminis]
MKPAAREMLASGARTLGLELTQQQLAQLDLLAEELKKWNKKINLTAITDDEGIATKHLVDSLTLLKVVRGPGRLLDLGSGGGFPCIPVKVVEPTLAMVSVDAVVKKISFQKNAARVLGLANFETLHARGELLAEQYPASFDWIVSRAFSDLPTFVSMALPLLKPEGRIVAMKGPGGKQEADEAKVKLESLGVELVGLQEFQLPGTSDQRSLLIYRISKN